MGGILWQDLCFIVGFVILWFCLVVIGVIWTICGCLGVGFVDGFGLDCVVAWGSFAFASC